mgnify:CR=1 FL=1
MTDTVETMEENIETPVRPVKPVQEQIDPKEWARKAASAYRYDTLVDNTHIPQMNRPKVIPVKETFESNSEYINNIDGSFGVRATKDIESGGLVEECHYWVMETRLNDFIKGTKDKIGVRLLWTMDCTEEETYKCEELGPHVMIPRGNAMSYNISENPNAYFAIDEVTRTIRFYALRPISKGETVTVSRPSEDALGFNGVTANEFREISGMNMAVPGDPSKKGCSSCQEKKKFRERSV